MFISKQEKESILAAIKMLQQDVLKLSLALSEILPANGVKGSGRAWTEEQKAKSSERMKKFWADKKNGASK